MLCPKCGSDASAEDRFCGKCGVPLPAMSSVEPALQVKPGRSFSKLRIEFARSSAASFPQALGLAKTFRTFAEFGSGKATIYGVDFSFEQRGDAASLAEFLKGWRNRWVYVDGERKQWSEVFNFSWCFDALRRAYRPEFHCFQGGYQNDVFPFGCALSNLGLINPTTGWLQSGTFDHESVFHFDKERMRRIMEENFYSVRFCPALDVHRALRVLTAFPESADLRRDRRWVADPVEKSSRPSAAAFVLTLQVSNGYYQKDRAYGLRAASWRAAVEILAEVASRARMRIPVLEA